MDDARALRHSLGYEVILRTVGRFCDKEQLDEVGVLEFDQGIIIQGLKVASTSEGYIRMSVTHTWSFEDIAKMAQPPETDQG